MTAQSIPATRTAMGATLPFALPIGLSAFLLFSVEPLVGRLVLPVFGGAPSVWATTLFFFQAVLLVGYLYGHLSVTRFGKWGPPIHLGLAAFGLFWLLNAPAAIAPLRNEAVTPVLDLIAILFAIIGLPGFILTTTTPLLSGWFNAARQEDGGDPYWLYALSNAGSLLALIAYPLLIEPRLGLGAQRSIWTVGYVILIVFVAWAAWRALPAVVRRPYGYFRGPELIGVEGAPVFRAASVDWPRRLRWLLLAAIPSGLLSAVTNFIATDLVSAPLLWVMPLAIYLGSFIVAFSPRAGFVIRGAVVAGPAAVTLLWVPYGSAGGWPILILLATELLAFAVVATALHGRLAEDRPDPAHLTEFYLIVSTGGALAAAFVALFAPNVFPDIWEYPILLVGALAALAVTARGSRTSDATTSGVSSASRYVATPSEQARTVAWPTPAGPSPAAATVPGARATTTARRMDFSPFFVGFPSRMVPYAIAAALLGIALILSGALATEAGLRWLLVGGLILAVGGRPWFLVLATAFVLVLATFVIKPGSEFQARSFFGVTEVLRQDNGAVTILMNGTTVHGMQRTDDPRAPTSYYDQRGPAGDIFSIGAASSATDPKVVGVVGLGAGGLSAYLDNWTSMTYFEIDPVVIRAASDPRLFTFLSDSPGSPRIVEGDARLSLVDEPAGRYDLLVMDAFSSDAIPLHLITVEAIRDAMRTLAPDGVIAFNVSNRYWDLSPAIGAALVELDAAPLVLGGGGDGRYLLPSRWLVGTSSPDRANAFRALGWEDVAPAVRPFTDDYADLLTYLRLGY